MFIASGSLVLSVVLCGVGQGALPAQPPPLPQTPASPVTGVAPAPMSPEQATAETGEKRWYGWQLLLSDAAFVTLAVNSSSTPGRLAAAGGLSLGAPLLHFANGNKSAGLVSLTVRLLLAGLAVAVATDKGTCQSAACETVGDAESTDRILSLLFLAATSVVFMVVDDTVLARVRVTPPRINSEPAHQRTGFQWGPVVAPARGGATMALVGRF